MKMTKHRLQTIIKEELTAVLQEQMPQQVAPLSPSLIYPGDYRRGAPPFTSPVPLDYAEYDEVIQPTVPVQGSPDELMRSMRRFANTYYQTEQETEPWIGPASVADPSMATTAAGHKQEISNDWWNAVGETLLALAPGAGMATRGFRRAAAPVLRRIAPPWTAASPGPRAAAAGRTPWGPEQERRLAQIKGARSNEPGRGHPWREDAPSRNTDVELSAYPPRPDVVDPSDIKRGYRTPEGDMPTPDQAIQSQLNDWAAYKAERQAKLNSMPSGTWEHDLARRQAALRMAHQRLRPQVPPEHLVAAERGWSAQLRAPFRGRGIPRRFTSASERPYLNLVKEELDKLLK
jgi:hypothetical protein